MYQSDSKQFLIILLLRCLQLLWQVCDFLFLFGKKCLHWNIQLLWLTESSEQVKGGVKVHTLPYNVTFN